MFDLITRMKQEPEPLQICRFEPQNEAGAAADSADLQIWAAAPTQQVKRWVYRMKVDGKWLSAISSDEPEAFERQQRMRFGKDRLQQLQSVSSR